jgi:hypothetical protein
MFQAGRRASRPHEDDLATRTRAAVVTPKEFQLAGYELGFVRISSYFIPFMLQAAASQRVLDMVEKNL